MEVKGRPKSIELGENIQLDGELEHYRSSKQPLRRLAGSLFLLPGPVLVTTSAPETH